MKIEEILNVPANKVVISGSLLLGSSLDNKSKYNCIDKEKDYDIKFTYNRGV